MEYLLLPENADKIMNSIDRPEIIIIKTTTSIKLINYPPKIIHERPFPKTYTEIKYKGVIKEKRDDHIVANQLFILIPVKIAIISNSF